MKNMIYILGEQIDTEQINQDLNTELGGLIQVEFLKTNEFGDINSASVIMIIFELGKDLVSSGLYDILKQSLQIIIQNIKPKKEKQEIKIVLGEKSCQISTNFNLTEKQREKLAQAILKEIM